MNDTQKMLQAIINGQSAINFRGLTVRGFLNCKFTSALRLSSSEVCNLSSPSSLALRGRGFGEAVIKQALSGKIDRLDQKADRLDEKLDKVERNLTNRIDKLGKQRGIP